MIRAVRCDQPSFRDVHLSPGFNVIMADRTKESTKQDTRNGLGKSSLIEIIHFCLGSTLEQGESLGQEPLRGWTFTLDLTLAGRELSVSRNTAERNQVLLRGDTADWFPGSGARTLEGLGTETVVNVSEWNALLGHLLFALPREAPEAKYKPSYRSLISYFIRRGRDAFSSPFDHHRKHSEWDKQLHNAFLLGLAWEDARDWQVLKDKEKVLNDLKRAAAAGMMPDMLGTMGELEARKVQLQSQLREQRDALSGFRVHPQYREIEQTANALTQEIHDLSNDNAQDRQLLALYQSSVEEEHPPSQDDVARVYEEAGVVFSSALRRRLEDVLAFHTTLLSNRRSFLAREIERLLHAIQSREEAIREKSDRRAEHMGILRTHGALEEHSRLQSRATATEAELRDVTARIDNLHRFNEGASSLRMEKEALYQRADADYRERAEARRRAIELFNANSQALHSLTGTLVIDVTQTGFRFDVRIERSRSHGVGSMKIFCYDLMLAELWAGREATPGILVHDSTIFDGVDERQIAHALELAAAKSAAGGFQYLCALNSDRVPWSEFSSGFSLDPYVRLRLTDATTDGGLLGIRF
ncbi:MAG: DUF2326 domain-containing protein [Planctomycetes bacterium]|nr:DUF2326 domain-containing protein [Planctomycetota bacterium]